MPNAGSSGFAFRCDLEGTVVEVLRDELGLEAQVETGRPFTQLIASGSLRKALDFLVELRDEGAAFGWELNVRIGQELETFRFAGGVVEGHMVIAGARTDEQLMNLYEQMVRIGNEQTNRLRELMKAQVEMTEQERENGVDRYNEITRLNNELVAMQRELARKNAELERLNEQKNRFLGMAAHDLRNPLHVIGAYSEFLIDDVAELLNEQQLEFLSIIESSSEFMAGLVDDLLDVSKIQSGKLTIEPRPTDLLALVRRNVTLNQTLAARKEIELRLDKEVPDDAFSDVSVDPDKITQVLNNLLSNAIKYSYPGGTVDVRVGRQDDRVLLSVRDRGQGIPGEKLDRLFEPFETVGSQGTGGEKSTGLGLAIVKQIVEAHRGRVWAESEEGEGATFYVSLPVGAET